MLLRLIQEQTAGFVSQANRTVFSACDCPFQALFGNVQVSFHKYGDYFFPGTGALHDKGEGRGRGYSVNVPLKDGATDAVFLGLYKPIIQKIMDVYRPGAIVLQCGADSLAADRLGCFMLTIAGTLTILLALLCFLSVLYGKRINADDGTRCIITAARDCYHPSYVRMFRDTVSSCE